VVTGWLLMSGPVVREIQSHMHYRQTQGRFSENVPTA
jgi:hypothetical protein